MRRHCGDGHSRHLTARSLVFQQFRVESARPEMPVIFHAHLPPRPPPQPYLSGSVPTKQRGHNMSWPAACCIIAFEALTTWCIAVGNVCTAARLLSNLYNFSWQAESEAAQSQRHCGCCSAFLWAANCRVSAVRCSSLARPQGHPTDFHQDSTATAARQDLTQRYNAGLPWRS